MASTIITKNSSTASAVPVVGDLTKGELAVNVTDKKIYTKDNSAAVVKLVGSLGNQEANAVAITGGSIAGITDLAVADGGTGASTASDARTNLGLGTIATQAASSVTITGGSVTGITDITVADGGTGASTAANARSNLGAAASGANSDITSLSGLTTALSVAQGGTGITSLGTGVATFLGTPSSANLASAVTDETGSGALVFANSPTLVTPALGTPSALVGTNITGTASGLTAGNVTTNANLTGAVTSVGNATSLGSFSSSNLAGALTDETGTGSAVFATSPTLVTPILGTPTSATLTNATGLPIATGVSGLGSGVATFLATPSSANLAAALTDETGTGSAVFATSPTLVTPALGTPSSGVVTNLTGTASININGTVGATTASTGAFTTLTTSSTVTINGGTANCVGFLNASKVLTTASALQFDGFGTLALSNSNSGGTNDFSVANTNANGYAALTIKNTGASGKTYEAGVGGNSTAGNYQNNFYIRNTTGNPTFALNLDNIIFIPGGTTEVGRFTSTGLGIGTSSPTQKLEIAGTTASTEARVTTTTALAGFRVNTTGGALALYLDNSAGSSFGAGAYSRNIYSDGAYPLLFWTNDQPRMRLDSSGNLGLGVTPSAWRSNTPAFQIGSAGVCLFADSGVTAEVGNNVFLNSSSQYIYLRTDAASRYRQYQGVHSWLTAASGTAGNAISFSTAMTLDAAGGLKTLNTIGVGNATPSTSGAGITFPATQSASSDANTLDDYEEGTWTPSLGGTATYYNNGNVGTYTKIGNVVTFKGLLYILSIGTGSTTQITGLPFTNAGLTGGAVCAAPHFSASATAISSANLNVATTTIYVYSNVGNTTSNQTANAFFQTGTYLEFSGTYQI